MRPRGTPQELEARRRRAVAMIGAGAGVQEVADRLGVSRRAVSKWKRPGGVEARPKPAPPRKLSEPQLRRLRGWLLEGPLACGFPTDLWTCPRVAKLIQDRLGVSYHPDHLSRLLRDLGFTPQKPVRRAAERDEAAIAGWVARDWPRIKKKRRG